VRWQVVDEQLVGARADGAQHAQPRVACHGSRLQAPGQQGLDTVGGRIVGLAPHRHARRQRAQRVDEGLRRQR